MPHSKYPLLCGVLLFLFVWLLLLSSPAQAQLTTVTAQVKDTNGTLYVNCTYSVSFHPNPNQTATYTYGGNPNFTKEYPGQRCDGSARLQIQLPDNVNSILPNDSQWYFNLCSAPGYVPGDKYCFATAIVITGSTQDITTQLTAVAHLLPFNYNFPFPLNTKGQLFGFGTTPSPVSVGADGTCLTADSTQLTGLKYGPCGGGSPPASTAGMIPVSTGPGNTYAAQAKPAVDIRDVAPAADCTGAAASDGALAAAGPHVIIPQNCVIKLSTTATYSANLEFKQGGQLSANTGTVITLTGCQTAARQWIYTGAGRFDFTGNQCITSVFPEWWGANATGSTAATNTVAIQNAVFGAFGFQNRVNGSPNLQWNKILSFCGTYNISSAIQFYHVIGFQIVGCNKQNAIIQQLTVGQRIVDGQNIAYGTFSNLQFSFGSGTANPGPAGVLVDIDNNHTVTPLGDLSPQQITFYDVIFFGNYQTDVGALISKHGSDAQGDNIRCFNCNFFGFTGAGWQIGGNNTGRNAGRFYAQNAIREVIMGGDCQVDPLYCIASYGGSVEVNGTTFEDDTGQNFAQTGYDMYCEAPQEKCIMRGVRSESKQLAAGVQVIEHSRTVFTPYQWRQNTLAGTSFSVGAMFSGTDICGDGKFYQATIGGTFSGLNSTTATSGTATSVTVSAATWIPSAFVGQQICVIAGSDAGYYGVITANTATTITFSGGLLSDYYQITGATPDSTTQFVVEPNWKSFTGAGPWTNGTVTFIRKEFNVVSAGAGVDFQDLELMGGQINIINGTLKDVMVSRTDWLGNAGTQPYAVDNQFNNLIKIDNVYIWGNNNFARVVVPGGGGFAHYIPWTFARNSGGNSFFSGLSFTAQGSRPICWEQGASQGGTSYNDICIGIRNDYSTGSSASRTVLGFLGTLGPATAFGVDQAGTINRIQGGLGSGAGVPGDIAFSTGNTTTSGSSVVDGTDRWKIVGGTGHLFAVADNTYDVGASGANRPRDVWVGRNLDVAGNTTFHGTVTGLPQPYPSLSEQPTYMKFTKSIGFSPDATLDIGTSTPATNIIQFKQAFCASVATCAATLSAASGLADTSAGNSLLMLSMTQNQNSTSTTATGLTFTQVQAPTGSSGLGILSAYLAQNIPGGPVTATVNYSASSATSIQVFLIELPPVTGVDGHSVGAAALNSGNITTTVTDMLVGYAYSYCCDSGAYTPNTSWTSAYNALDSTGRRGYFEYIFTQPAGTYAASSSTGTTSSTFAVLALTVTALVSRPRDVNIGRQLTFNETSPPTANAAFDQCYGDSSVHAIKCAYNGGSYYINTQTIASGTATLGISAIASGACATVVTIAATGVLATDVISWTPNADISAATGYTPGGGLNIYVYPTANTMNFKVCNGSASSVTPGAVTLNARVAR